MWEFTKDNEEDIKKIVDYFLSTFPDISPKDLYDRILNGYCYGEGGKIWLMTIDDWKAAFKGDKFFTCFKDWNEYFKYDGDWHKKLQNEKR